MGTGDFMAARHLDMQKVPVRIREIDDEQAARFALWENLAREDLDPMDLAESINGLRLVDRLSWDDIGQRFGFSRQWAWKQQKIVELPNDVKDLVRDGQLAPSKAMLLAQVTTGEADILSLAQRAVTRRLSHRDLAQFLISRKHVLTSVGQERGDTEPSRARKHVLTWIPPDGLPPRSYSRLNRAAEDMVAAFNEGRIDPEYAQSLKELAQSILSLAEEPPTSSRRRLKTEHEKETTKESPVD